MTDPRVLLRMADVVKRYGRRTVLEIESFNLHHGDKIGLYGLNGSGKSTFLRLIAGITAATRGEVSRVEEFHRLKIGFVPQAGGLYEDLTLRQNLALYSCLYGTQPDEENAFVNESGLARFIDIRIGVLSGGFQQLASIACVLASAPDALLLDEPASDLDDDHKQYLRDTLALLADRLSFIVVATHDPRDLSFANRHVLMQDGRPV